MKTTINKENARNNWTMSEYDQAKELQKYMKEDATAPISAMNFGADAYAKVNDDIWVDEIIKADARIEKNCRIEWNYYNESSGRFDVWIEGMFKASALKDGKLVHQIVELGFYLSDGYALCYDDVTTHQTLMYHSYCRVYEQQ